MILERMVQVLGSDLDAWMLAGLVMLRALVQQVLESLSSLQDLAWVLLLAIVAVGLVFLLDLCV